MTSNLSSALAKGLFQKRDKDETEQSLERATSGGDQQVPPGEPESGESILKRAVENNDKRTDE